MNDVQPLSDNAQSIKPGIYEHYKGHQYRVIGISRHSETLEELVVYQALYGEGDTWVRPVSMWNEKVDSPNGLRPRFKFISK